MVLSTLTGLLANLFVVYSGNNSQDNPISYQTYLNSIGATSSYNETYFYENYNQTEDNVTIYIPIYWEANANETQHYFMFYWNFNNGNNSSFPYYLMGGFGYNTTWQTGSSFRWYIPKFNSNDIAYQSIDNLSLSVSVFDHSGTPYYDGANMLEFNSSIDYSVFDRTIDYGVYTLNGSKEINVVDDPSVGFGALLTFNLGSSIPNADTFYNQGYSQGYSDGYNTGYNNGEIDGNNTGFDTGYRSGYTIGFQDGARSGQVSLFSIMGAIVDTPIYLLRSLFDYELFGISIYTALLSLITFIVVLWLIRKFI